MPPVNSIEYREYLAKHFSPDKQELIIETFHAAVKLVKNSEKLSVAELELAIKGL